MINIRVFLITILIWCSAAISFAAPYAAIVIDADTGKVLHFENANIAHMGDLLFNRRFPYIDKSSGASIENWIAVLQGIRATYDNDTLFVFGHGKSNDKVTGNKEDLKAFENYLEQLLVYVKQGIADGKTADELASVPFIPNAPEWTGDGIRRSIDAALIELQGN